MAGVVCVVNSVGQEYVPICWSITCRSGSGGGISIRASRIASSSICVAICRRRLSWRISVRISSTSIGIVIVVVTLVICSCALTSPSLKQSEILVALFTHPVCSRSNESTCAALSHGFGETPVYHSRSSSARKEIHKNLRNQNRLRRSRKSRTSDAGLVNKVGKS